MINNFYTNEELVKFGFLSLGNNVKLSRKASIYSVEKISIGNNVRIDDFCILSGQITIGDFVHVAAYSSLYGGEKGIFIEDFANISSKISIYAVSDDYSGDTLTSPLIPDKYKKLKNERVHIGRHVIIGTGSVVLPGVTLKEGSSFGAMTLINKSSEEWSINVGIPFKKIKVRSKNLLHLEKKFRESLENSENLL